MLDGRPPSPAIRKSMSLKSWAHSTLWAVFSQSKATIKKKIVWRFEIFVALETSYSAGTNISSVFCSIALPQKIYKRNKILNCSSYSNTVDCTKIWQLQFQERESKNRPLERASSVSHNISFHVQLRLESRASY